MDINKPLTFTVNPASSGYMVEDAPSPEANFRRGYHDYILKVTFWNTSEALRRDIVQVMYERLREAKRDMWVSPPVWKGDVATIRHGYDSGD